MVANISVAIWFHKLFDIFYLLIRIDTTLNKKTDSFESVYIYKFIVIVVSLKEPQ